MAFVRTYVSGANYETPGELYRDLPRRSGAVPGLWAHQSEMLKTFTSSADKPDVALELPTGTGKTLTGLLIAEWTRRKRRARVIYACPTQQLARQVAASAHREGINVSLLVGGHADWPSAEHAAYEGAEAIAVTTYSSIFNSNPQLVGADLILFDDAHAGEQYIGEAYSVNLNRRADSASYNEVLDVVAPALDKFFIERLRSDKPDPTIGQDVQMVVPLRQPDMVDKLHSTLNSFSKPHRYRFSMIRASLASCLVYVAYSGILIRPYIPPTHQNDLFSNARQRVYLSATLGEGGELERAFGRSKILRLQQPDESTAPRYGRRFFVFPEFVEGLDVDELSRSIVQAAGKALILAPRTQTAMGTARALAQPGWQVLGLDDVSDSIAPFAELDHGMCGLAARYDGLDLPGDTCRLVGLKEVPNQDNLQERFLQSRARAGAAIASRVRTRVIQGAGRCTRGPEDTAIVLVLGSDLSRYLTRPEVTDALDSELQAEIRFGRENSQGATVEDVLGNIDAFLHQDTDETWRTEAEPALTDYRREMAQRVPDGTDILSDCVDSEIQAWESASVGAWRDAAKYAHEVTLIAGKGGKTTKGYRAFWMYLQAIWSDHSADLDGDNAGRSAAQGLVRQAEEIMGLASWVRQMAPLPQMQRSDLNAVDAIAVNAVATMLNSGITQRKLSRTLDEMCTGLGERAPGKYEPALTSLGKLVGADAKKPGGTTRCDSVWCWDNELWLALEAKSNHEPTGLVPPKDIRQVNDQLRLLAKDRGIESAPPESATVVISPKPGIDPDAITAAEHHVHFVAPAHVSELAQDVASAWESIFSARTHRTLPQLRELVTQTFSARGILASQIHERLTRDPVASRDQ